MYGRSDRAFGIALLATASAVLALAVYLHPAACGFGTHTQLGLPPCNFRQVTHLPCPSCGLTTSFAYASRFHFRQAFAVTAIGPVAFTCTLLSIPFGAFILWKRIPYRRILESSTFSRAVYLACAAYVGNWIYMVATVQLPYLLR